MNYERMKTLVAKNNKKSYKRNIKKKDNEKKT